MSAGQEHRFMADSIRVPTNTESLIVLNVQAVTNGDGVPTINTKLINGLGRAEKSTNIYVVYSEEQNVSTDLYRHGRSSSDGGDHSRRLFER